jgi:hypothetical protein
MRKRTIGILMGAALLAGIVQPADAGFLERLFGTISRAIAPPVDRPPPGLGPVTPAPPPGGDMYVRPESGPRSAYCVRTCDGHYFPVHANANMNAVQMCQAFCPAAETKLFAGGGIDYAVAPDGARYRDLPNAFLYRKQLVAGCTCNGKDVFGVAKIDISKDPTLSRGDLVATEDGLAAVTGRDQNGLQLSKVDQRGVSPRERRQSAGTPPNRVPPPAPSETTGSAAGED